ncbi:MAG: glucose-6-phosphate isomerase [Clostridiaceae bacterium]|nr:glucose-6-phosphate isomerase [Clostridiaceae bacterium]
MEDFNLNLDNALKFLDYKEFEQKILRAGEICSDIINNPESDKGMKGWISTESNLPVMDQLKSKAEEIRENADVFILVGVGGSNQAARAVIKALQKDIKPKVLYAGNTLSAHYLSKLLDEIQDQSVYINVIAKNFETLEPGSHFRVLRKVLESRYSKEEMARRIILTGTHGSRLEEIAKENGYLFLPFPKDIGGRYSAFSPVGIFPVMVAGIDTDSLIRGVNLLKKHIYNNPENNIAVQYAAYRNLAYEKGFDIEVLASFEPRLEYFIKWWIQLFGESEGKDKKGIFPSGVIYSEDLHSMGQYLQDGRRNLIETFIKIKDPQASVIIPPDRDFIDGFDYLDRMDFVRINQAAEKATIEAHTNGGVPCAVLELQRIDEKSFGMLFYFFMIACAISGKLMGVNPFDQEGVEEYKRSMFKALGRDYA